MNQFNKVCTPVTETSTEVQKIDYAICRTNSAALVLRDLAIELEKHDAVSAAMIRQMVIVTTDVIDRLYSKKVVIIRSLMNAIHTADYARVLTGSRPQSIIVDDIGHDDGHDGTIY